MVHFDDSVFGFVKGRSATMAAARHCGAEWVYSVDIADFFPSTPASRVEASLTQLGYPEHGAELITKLCCYAGTLSQGSPASPVLSNLVFREVDDELNSLTKKHCLRYTRYADDIVFSSTGPFPEVLKSEVRAAIESRQWRVAEKKERFSKRPNRLKVHGLLVHGSRPRLTKGYRSKIRAFRHMLDAGKVKDEDLARLRGHLSYARAVDMAG
jgi:retron-type reverse transcriptase